MASSYYSTNSLVANTVTVNSTVTNALSANSLTVAGTIFTPQLTATNGMGITGNLTTSGNIQSGGFFVGNGSQLTGIAPTTTLTLSGFMVSSNVLTASGTAAAPGHSFSGNAATGMFLASANVLGLSTTGSERVRVDASGNVGVGTSAPLGTFHVSGTSTLQQITEVLNAKTGATGNVTHDYATGSVFYHSSIAANFTCNLTNVATTDSRAIATTLILSQGATPYMSNAFQINGSAQTVKWQGNTVPTGTASKVDVVTFSLIRTGAAWTVLGQNTNFG